MSDELFQSDAKGVAPLPKAAAVAGKFPVFTSMNDAAKIIGCAKSSLQAAKADAECEAFHASGRIYSLELLKYFIRLRNPDVEKVDGERMFKDYRGLREKAKFEREMGEVIDAAGAERKYAELGTVLHAALRTRIMDQHSKAAVDTAVLAARMAGASEQVLAAIRGTYVDIRNHAARELEAAVDCVAKYEVQSDVKAAPVNIDGDAEDKEGRA